MSNLSQEKTKSGLPLEQFAKDHWSLLAFVETRCVDFKGQLDYDRLRCNRDTHSAQFLLRKYPTSTVAGTWKHEWGTRLKDGTVVPEHDDWDCLDDLEAAGLVETLSYIKSNVRLTERGLHVAQQLRVFKAQGGQYKDFQFSEERGMDEGKKRSEQDGASVDLEGGKGE